MNRVFTTVALALALGFSLARPRSERRSARINGGHDGGRCPMIGMMGQDMMGPGMMAPSLSGQGMMAGRQVRIGAMVDGRLAYLKGELSIADAQSEAWNGYANAVKGRVDVMQGMRGP